jgi:hypothetical protein
MAVAAAAAEAVPLVREEVEHQRQVMLRELGVFDVEKWALQSMYGMAIFLVGKGAYHMYYSLKWADWYMRNPPPPSDWLQSLISQLPFFGTMQTTWRMIDQIGDAGEQDKAWLAAWQAEWRKDPVSYLTPVFETYWFLILLGIPVMLGLQEKRRVDKFNRRFKRR